MPIGPITISLATDTLTEMERQLPVTLTYIFLAISS